MNLESPFYHNSKIVADSIPQIIKIEETQAYQRSKNRAAVESNRQEDRSNEILTNAIGAHRISQQYELKQHRFDLQHLNTDNFDLVDIQWQGAFELAQDPLVDRYVIYLVLSGALDQKINRHQTFCCSPDTATIINSGETVESYASEEGEVLLISIDRDLIDSTLAKLLDKTLKQPVIFLSSIDLTRELGMSLKKFVRFLWEAAATDNSTDFSLLVLQKLGSEILVISKSVKPSKCAYQLVPILTMVWDRGK